jgi:two-component system, NtrC family, sensor kinase
MRKVPMRSKKRHEANALASVPSPHAPAAPSEESSPRARIPELVPAGWLDRLLVAAVDLPVLHGEVAVIEAMVDAVFTIVPGCAVGACFVPSSGGQAPERTVVRRFPAATREASAGVDPTRLFPGLASEYVSSIAGSLTGSTLHIASDDDDLDHDTSAIVHLVDRAATALGRALALARAVASLEGQRRDASALEQRMLQADKLANFGQIAAGIVHELNNPLTSIVAYSDYLIRRSLTGASARDTDDVERLRRISESATRMLRFTRDLVSYAHPSGSVPGPVLLHAVIDQAIAFCEHVLTSSGVRVERRFGIDLLTVRAVGEQLVQVFVNLLTNASQAAPARDGWVAVTTELDRDAKRVTVVVADNGAGIAPNHLPHVFVPFFTTRRDREGTGLGLSIVKTVVENHGGAVRVESELGRGTRFIIGLPVW